METATPYQQGYSREEKHQTSTTEAPIYEVEEAKPPALLEWTPGYLSRFPWLGLGSLCVVLACVAAAIVTLIVSDGRSQSKWPKWIAPNVILSGINSISNISLAIAVGNGVAIAWWRKTLKGATIEELHQSWSFSKSMMDIAFAGRAFNFIALATLVAKFAFVDSLLMQSATSTRILPEASREVSLEGFANETWPYTGRVVAGGSGQPGLLTSWFQGDLLMWAQNPASFPLIGANTQAGPTELMFEGCNGGSCEAAVPAIGFQFDCSAPSSESIIFNASTMATETYLFSNGTLKSQNLFSLSFGFQWNTFNMDPVAPKGPPANLTMSLTWTDSAAIGTDAADLSCRATKFNQFCVLRPAVISYPVRVEDTADDDGKGVRTISFVNRNDIPFDSRGKQLAGFDFVQDIGIYENHARGGTGDLSQLAGIQQALTMHLGGEANVQFNGIDSWILSQDGNAARYLLNQPSVQECNWKYTNPLIPGDTTSLVNPERVIMSINQIMFALAIDISHSDPNNVRVKKSYRATRSAFGIHYITNIWYMIGAAISTCLVVLCICPVYYGYWQLGRKVTLGPVEIAHAFRSPMTAQATSGNIEQLVEQVGHQKVQFGHIVTGDAAGIVGVAEPEYVARL